MFQYKIKIKRHRESSASLIDFVHRNLRHILIGQKRGYVVSSSLKFLEKIACIFISQ